MKEDLQDQKDINKQTTNFLPLLLVGAGLILLVVFGMGFLSDESPRETGAQIFPPITVDQPAPELSLLDLDGQPVSLSDYQGKVLLVNNWAIWCPPCRVEMPEFNTYFKTHQAEGFEILAVEAGDPENEVRAYVEEAGLDFRIALDPEGKSLETFQNRSLPNSFVIDRKGNLRLAWLGAINLATLEEYVSPLLKE